MPQSILVTGATGTLGRHVVARLRTGGHDPRVFSRYPGGDVEGVPRMVGDLRTGAGLDAAVAGVDVIVHCATAPRGDVDAVGPLLEAARRAGSPHLVYVSIVGVDRVPLRYYRAKLEVERLVAGSGLPFTILRATQFHDLVVRMLSAQHWAPMLVVPAGTSFQPIAASEVADRLVELAGADPAERVPDIGGPEVREATDLARSYLRATGRRQLVLALRVPGRIARAFRAGGHLTPEHAVGHVRFEQDLAARTSETGRH